MKLYFAHNFNDRKTFRDLEIDIEEATGVELFNPFYDVPDRAKEMERFDRHKFSDRERIMEIESLSDEECELIVYRDLAALAMCDGLFTIIKKPSIGTTIELVNAKTMAKKVYVVSNGYGHHPWIRVYADAIFQDIDAFKNFMVNMR